jgi:hypothetical protein
MSAETYGDGPRPAGRRALVRYALGWLVPATVIVLAALLLLRDGEETVAVPVVEQTELTSAADRAGCVLRRGVRDRGVVPVDGPPARPAEPRFHDRPPPDGALVGALRRGVVVIHYAPSLPDDDVDQLRAVQESAPKGTLVTPNDRMGYRVAVTAYHRVLACRRFDDRTAEALQLFRGRYVGFGPD